MPEPAFVRLGPSSAKLSQNLAQKEPGPTDDLIELECAQVPSAFGKGSNIWLWLGSDNNKGTPTDWNQGVRAFGRCDAKKQLPGTRDFEVAVRLLYVLPRSVEKVEFLRSSPLTYAASLFDMPIVGLNNYSSQVVQTLTNEQFLTLTAMVARILPESSDDLFELVEDAARVEVLEHDLDALTLEPERELLPIDIPDDDPVYRQVLAYLDGGEAGGVLLVGPPGTGKSWYAMQIAAKLVERDAARIRRVQFHPAYQYEDFVEGYVPRGAGRFTLEKKHLLLAAEKARRTRGRVVVIIDEFSRTDPSRVLGETLTYMEASLRDQDFLLPSGRTACIPKNLVFLATMNPDDRSVDEIDAAMERRWAKISLRPDPSKVAQFLRGNGAAPALIGPVVEFFNSMQKHVAVGHAFFRKVKDLDSLDRLWEGQLRHLAAKRYRYDDQGRARVDQDWQACEAKVRAALNAGASPGTTPVGETPAPNVA